MSALVQIDNLRARRGSFELNIPRWEVQPGTVVGVVGPNGAGKTTLLRLLPGLDDVNGGSVRVFGHDPVTHPVEVRSNLGYMTDALPLFNMRLDKLFRHLSGYYANWDKDLVETLVERFDLDLSATPATLSKGAGSKLRLTVALAMRPRLLVLDEPATGLDLAGRRTLLELVLEYLADERCAVVISSHQLHDIERIADRLLVLGQGEVRGDGPTAELVGDERTLEEAMVDWGVA